MDTPRGSSTSIGDASVPVTSTGQTGLWVGRAAYLSVALSRPRPWLRIRLSLHKTVSGVHRGTENTLALRRVVLFPSLLPRSDGLVGPRLPLPLALSSHTCKQTFSSNGRHQGARVSTGRQETHLPRKLRSQTGTLVPVEAGRAGRGARTAVRPSQMSVGAL